MRNEAALEAAKDLRQKGEHEKALSRLRDLCREAPGDPLINYRLATVLDSLGRESEAVGHYVAAIDGGLSGTDRASAYLGLGSTYRALSEYAKSKEIFDRALKEFPEDRALQVFAALTLYNLGQKDKCVEMLLLQMLDTTSDIGIKSYDRALRFYADKLDQTWK